MDDLSFAHTERFVRDENIRRYENEIRTEADATRRSVLLRLLVEEENRLGWSHEQLAIAEQRITSLNKSVERQLALIDRMAEDGQDTTAAKDLLLTLRQLLALHRWFHDKIIENLNGLPVVTRPHTPRKKQGRSDR